MPLSLCSHCAGSGHVEFRRQCPHCGGGRLEPICFDLGETRTYPKGRPVVWNPGRSEISVARGKKRTDYRLHEFVLDRAKGEAGTRAFAFVKLDDCGEPVETHHVEVSSKPGMHKCDCRGFQSEAAARANRLAWDKGEPVFGGSFGCLHLDCVLKLTWDELFVQTPAEVV